MPCTADPHVLRVVRRYETLTRATLPELMALYAQDATFRDPFNHVQGRAAIARIFERMFERVDEPRFAVSEVVQQHDVSFLVWDFTFRTRGMRGRRHVIHGTSRLRLQPDGLIAEHRDYWDAAEELYEKLPLIGALMRWLKRRL